MSQLSEKELLMQLLGGIGSQEVQSALSHDWLLNNLWEASIAALTSERQRSKEG